jgi:hypothetical protein
MNPMKKTFKSKNITYMITGKKSVYVGNGIEPAISKRKKYAHIPETVVYEGVSYTVKGISKNAFLKHKRLIPVNIEAALKVIPRYIFGQRV